MTRSRVLLATLAGLLLFNLSLSYPAFSIGPKKNSGAAAQTESMEIRDKWAILVGVNRFSDPAIASQKFAQRSSADMARALKDPDFGHFAPNHVLLLNGPDANKSAIEQSLNDWLFKKAMPDDMVVLYFNTRLIRNAAGETILCTNDTQTKDPDASGFNLSELLTNARQRIGSTHMLCLLDTNPCESNEVKPRQDLKSLAASSGMAVFSAAELFKPSLDDPANMQSLFAHFFVEAIKTGGANFPLAMLAEYVWQKIQEETKTSVSAGQTAILSLANEHSGTVAIPIGIMVRSSMPPKTVKIGHPLDTLAFDRPDIIPPTMNPNKSTLNLQSHSNRGLPPTAVSSGANAAVLNQVASGTQEIGRTVNDVTSAGASSGSGTSSRTKPAELVPDAATANSSSVPPAILKEALHFPASARTEKSRSTATGSLNEAAHSTVKSSSLGTAKLSEAAHFPSTAKAVKSSLLAPAKLNEALHFPASATTGKSSSSFEAETKQSAQLASASAATNNDKRPLAMPFATKAVASSGDDDNEDDVDLNLDLRPYVAKIKTDIQSKWQPPKGFESQHVTTMFSIMRDGRIDNASIVEGSGNPAVDDSALAALRTTSPLAPLPKGAPQSIDIKYVFDWKTKMESQSNKK